MSDQMTVATKEAIATAMEVELDRHHQWDAPDGPRPRGCGHSRLSPYDFEKMTGAVLALPGIVQMSEWTLRKVRDELSHNCPPTIDDGPCATCYTKREVEAALQAYMAAHRDHRVKEVG